MHLPIKETIRHPTTGGYKQKSLAVLPYNINSATQVYHMPQRCTCNDYKHIHTHHMPSSLYPYERLERTFIRD